MAYVQVDVGEPPAVDLGQSGSEATFSSTSHVLSETAAAGTSRAGQKPAFIGYPISAYVTPVGTSVTPPGPPTAARGRESQRVNVSVPPDPSVFYAAPPVVLASR